MHFKLDLKVFTHVENVAVKFLSNSLSHSLFMSGNKNHILIAVLSQIARVVARMGGKKMLE